MDEAKIQLVAKLFVRAVQLTQLIWARGAPVAELEKQVADAIRQLDEVD